MRRKLESRAVEAQAASRGEIADRVETETGTAIGVIKDRGSLVEALCSYLI